MRTRFTSRSHSPREHGVALVLTLAILALVTLLLIAFVGSMRVENAASKNFNELIKARELAQAGVDEAIGTMRMYAPPVSTVTNYVTGPGVIYTWSPNIQTSTHWTNVALFTSDPSNPSGINLNGNNGKEVDLNTNFVISGQGTFYTANNANSQLWVGWSNVTYVAMVNGMPQPPVLVGRYAYWVDDESAKVNLNVAGTRGNDLEGWTPAAIDLRALFGQTYQVAITNYASQVRPFDTIESLKMAQSQIPSTPPPPGITDTVYSNNQFFVTVHSTSPDITPWGDKRVNLSNLVASATSKAAAVTTIAASLTAEDTTLAAWFNKPSFSAKYPSWLQIAANIVDYITIDNIPSDNSTYNDTAPPTFLGLKQTPYLNELVISNVFQVSQSPTTPGLYTMTINSYPFVELWYMYTNSAGWAVPTKTSVIILASPLRISVNGGFNPGSFTMSNYTINSGFNAMVAGPNTYQVVPPITSPVLMNSASLPLNTVTPPAAVTATLNPGTITAIFTSQQPGNKGRMDFASIGFYPKPVTVSIPIPTIAGAVTSVSALWAAQCNDPRVKPISNTWKQNLNAPTLGLQNGSLTFTGSGTISGDGDWSCHIVSATPNTGGRQRGTMTPGEMAFIHTGAPWRTFWLEPQPSAEQSAGLVPDWAILDLVSGTDVPNVVGRININQTITNSVYVSPTLNRLSPGPLSALLTNNLAGLGTTYILLNAETAIYDYYLNTATTPRAYTASQLGPYFCPYAYTMAGEIANTPSLTAPGASSTKALTETPIRDIANLVTPRSNTFTIWCIAQSIKKVDKTVANLGTFTTGVDVVTGEAKVQAIVERTVDTSAGTPGVVKFHTLYYRYLYQ